MRAHTSPVSEASTSAPSIFSKAKNYVTSASSNDNSSPRSPSKKYGWKFYILLLIALIILGTFIVLRTVVHFFGTHKEDFITLQEVQSFTNIEALPFNADITPEEAAEEERQLGLPRELIPRIIHATWKNTTLPEKWEIARRDCMAMLPDYDFKLWTDDSSREFIASEYPSFIPTWDSYPYTIQRADAIRYFVLHKYGGIYMDLDIGCRAPPHPLLHFPAILPMTKPVGVSNDLMFSAPRTPFLDLVIHSLDSFNHNWLFMPYATVMFSTGPMFISAMYSMWCRILQRGTNIDPAKRHLYHRVRILPKSLYGKNILPEDAPNSFYYHYYGSSWHAGDAGFVGFLGKYGYRLLLLGTTLVLVACCYIMWNKRHLLPFTPRFRKASTVPFENMTVPQSSMDNRDNAPDSPSFLKSQISQLTNLFKHSDAEVTKGSYMPLATIAPNRQIRQRSNTFNSGDTDDTRRKVSSTPPTARRGPKVHPVTGRPHSRQRSRDIERGPATPAVQAGLNSDNNQSPWLWPEADSQSQSRYQNVSYSPPLLSQEPPSLHVTEAADNSTLLEGWEPETRYERRTHERRRRSSRSSSSSSGSDAASFTGQSPQGPLGRPTTSRNASFLGDSYRPRQASPSQYQDEDTMFTRPRTSSNGTTDGEVSASELLDMLTDLEPVTSASASVATRSGVSIPSERSKDSQAMRKRSLSSEGERFRE